MCVHTSQSCTLMWVLEAVSNVCSHVTVLHADVGLEAVSNVCSHVTVLHAGVGVGSSQQCVFTRYSPAR